MIQPYVYVLKNKKSKESPFIFLHYDILSALEPLSGEPLLSECSISWDIITSMYSVLCPSDPSCRSRGSVCAHSSDRCDLLSDILLQARTHASLYLRKVLETSQG